MDSDADELQPYGDIDSEYFIHVVAFAWSLFALLYPGFTHRSITPLSRTPPELPIQSHRESESRVVSL